MVAHKKLGIAKRLFAMAAFLMACEGDPLLDSDSEASGLDEAVRLSPACTVTARSARCTSRTIQEVGVRGDLRRVYWATPTTAAPADGYPAVVLYQGSFGGPALTWNKSIAVSTGFGLYYQVKTVAELLESGYVVIQPEAENGTFWTTNTTFDFSSSKDGVFVPELLEQIEAGAFGQVDSSKLYAMGLSSGGYMTSRMAVSFPGRFRALAIQSASYATCAGAACFIPFQLPSDHPPTLFLHGQRDAIVPISTANTYESRLRGMGIPTKFVRNARAGHQWLSASPSEIVQWFNAH